MPLFTFTPQFEDSTGEPAEVDCPDAVTAIKEARGHLQAIINESPTVNRESIGVGEGTGDAVHWLGAWDWTEDSDRWDWHADS